MKVMGLTKPLSDQIIYFDDNQQQPFCFSGFSWGFWAFSFTFSCLYF